MKLGFIGKGAWGSCLHQLAVTSDYGLGSHSAPPLTITVYDRQYGQSLADFASGLDVIVAALPMNAVPEVALGLENAFLENAFTVGRPPILVSATKGLNASTLRLPSDYWQQIVPKANICVLSGPNLSAEIKAGQYAEVELAGSPEVTKQVRTIFQGKNFGVYCNTDIKGTELGGTLKNYCAIMAGILNGLGEGENTKSAFITHALQEMKQIGHVLGAKADTFDSLSGLGDLITTCNGSNSRNQRFGRHLAGGLKAEEALKAVASTVEGYWTVEAIHRIIQQHRIPAPICQTVYDICYKGAEPRHAITAMFRDMLPR